MTDPVPFLRGCEGPLFQVAAAEIERLRSQRDRLGGLLIRVRPYIDRGMEAIHQDIHDALNATTDQPEAKP